MTKIGKLWTDSVAYIALLVSAGLSLAGNVVDTYRVRGTATDTLDIWLAITWPGLVVLMVHVFVSARWIGLGWPMQVLRWLGCISIGAVAMRASWIHLNDLMVSRGQVADVAVLGPLAIDFLAIMSTALILAGRSVPAPAKPSAIDILTRRQAEADRNEAMTRPLLSTMPVDLVDPPERAVRPSPVVTFATDVTPEDMESFRKRFTVADEAQSYLDRLADQTDSATTPAHPIETGSLDSNRVRPESVPADARICLAVWHSSDPATRPVARQADEALAVRFGVSPRTARRWRDACKPSTVE